MLGDGNDEHSAVSSSSEDEHEDYLIVEERGTNSISPVILKEWLIPGERAYWFPGSKSDKQHSDYLHAKLMKTPDTEAAMLKGRPKYKWERVEYTKILREGNDLRQVSVARGRFSDSETDSDVRKKVETQTAVKGATVTKPSSTDLKKGLGKLPTSVTHKKKASSKQNTTDERVVLVLPNPPTDSTPDTLLEGGSSGSLNVLIKERCTVPKENLSVTQENTLGEDSGAVVSHTQPRPLLDDDASFNISGNWVQDFGGTGRQELEKLLEHIDLPSEFQNVDSQEKPEEAESVPKWVKSLQQELAIVKRRLAILPLMSRQVCDMAAKVNELRVRADAATRTMTADQENKGNCSLVTAYVPIKTRTQFEAVDERLKTDEEFIRQFITWLTRIDNLYKDSTLNHRIQRTLKAMFNESITTFGNWSGTKKLINAHGKKSEITCLAFKDTEVFTTIATFFGETFLVKEWIRNTNNTRLRYHSKQSTTPEKPTATPRKRLTSPKRSTPKKRRTVETSSSRVQREIEESVEPGPSIVRNSPRSEDDGQPLPSMAQRSLSFSEF